MSTNFAKEFQLYEHLFNTESGQIFLSEDFQVKCSRCGSTVTTDKFFMCPNCPSEYLLDTYVIDSVLNPNSPWILIYNKNGVIGKSNINNNKNPLGKTNIIHVNKEFFDAVLPVTRHKITSEDSIRGGFKLEDLDPTTAELVERAFELA